MLLWRFLLLALVLAPTLRRRDRRDRYHTCHTRHRYGTDACDGDRIPAGELDNAALNGVLALFGDRDLFDRVAADAADRRHADRTQRQDELGIINADITKTEHAIDRYLLASKPAPCPKPNADPGSASSAPSSPTSNTAAANCASYSTPTIRPRPPTTSSPPHASTSAMPIDNGDDRHRKHLLQALVAETRVQARDDITPVYRVPHA